MSFSNDDSNCLSAPNSDARFCNAMQVAWQNDLLMVAAAGNNRFTTLRAPARDSRVVSVGGSHNGAFWDDAPDCPFPGSDRDCGSNRANDTGPATSQRQELVAPAKEVRSTLFPGITWNATIQCGDGFPASDNAPADGSGLCTGTSMSAPMVAGLFGLLRSINPLMRSGNAASFAIPGLTVTPSGLRQLVAQTASRTQAGLPEDRAMGFGLPDASAAVKKMLGTVRGEPVTNRVTPLFGLYSPGGRDYAAVATPQLAMALTLYSTNAYSSSSPGVTGASNIPGYEEFPNSAAGVPKARALILTTEGAYWQPGPPRVPLFLLEKKRAGAVACNTATDPRCYGDFILVSSATQVQSAVTAGYNYAGRQGFLFAACSPDPACRPLGTEPLHLKCYAAHQDCAVFLESNRASFEAAGYTAGFLGASNTVLGYAYPVSDTDGDGLPDGLEHIIGTSISAPDSDGDGLSDAAEYPFDRAPVSDPCDGPAIACPRGIEKLFRNGFEQ